MIKVIYLIKIFGKRKRAFVTLIFLGYVDNKYFDKNHKSGFLYE